MVCPVSATYCQLLLPEGGRAGTCGRQCRMEDSQQADCRGIHALVDDRRRSLRRRLTAKLWLPTPHTPYAG